MVLTIALRRNNCAIVRRGKSMKKNAKKTQLLHRLIKDFRLSWGIVRHCLSAKIRVANSTVKLFALRKQIRMAEDCPPVRRIIVNREKQLTVAKNANHMRNAVDDLFEVMTASCPAAETIAPSSPRQARLIGKARASCVRGMSARCVYC